jgi:hypothetical protein
MATVEQEAFVVGKLVLIRRHAHRQVSMVQSGAFGRYDWTVWYYSLIKLRAEMELGSKNES